MDKTRDRKVPPLFTSITFHAFVLGVIVFLMSREPEGGSNSEPIQIESIMEKKSSRGVRQHRSEKIPMHRSTSPLKSHTVTLSDLGMRLNPYPMPEQAQSAEDSPPVEVPDADAWDVMNPDPRVARFNQYIYHTVQGWLDRDAQSNLDQIFGTVRVKIWFDGEGNYLEDETEYEAIDPKFKRIVAIALRKSFSMPIPRPFMYIHQKFSIQRLVGIRSF